MPESESPGAPDTPDVTALRDRMKVIKTEVAADVDKHWGSPWRTPAVFDLKVNARLAGHTEYRELQRQVAAAEAPRPKGDAGPPR